MGVTHGHSRMKFSIFLVLVICVAFSQERPRPQCNLCNHANQGTADRPGWDHGSGSGVSGTTNWNTGGSLADSFDKPECKWFVNRWGRPTSQNCKPTCRCSSRG